MIMFGVLKPNRQVKYQSWHGWLFLAVVFIAIVLALFDYFNPDSNSVVVMSQAVCEEAGGTWNSCASACRGSGEACIDICLSQCECRQSAECPDGYQCTDFIQSTGVCTKE